MWGMWGGWGNMGDGQKRGRQGHRGTWRGGMQSGPGAACQGDKCRGDTGDRGREGRGTQRGWMQRGSRAWMQGGPNGLDKRGTGACRGDGCRGDQGDGYRGQPREWIQGRQGDAKGMDARDTEGTDAVGRHAGRQITHLSTCCRGPGTEALKAARKEQDKQLSTSGDVTHQASGDKRGLPFWP